MTSDDTWDGNYIHDCAWCDQSSPEAIMKCGLHLSTWTSDQRQNAPSVEEQVGYTFDASKTTCPACLEHRRKERTAKDTIKYHLSLSIRQHISAQQWRDRAQLDWAESFGGKEMCLEYAAKIQGSAYGHGFRALELASDGNQSRFIK